MEPIKSLSDTRNYRYVTLQNGLDCLLISDSTTDKASACMDVHVGTLYDPQELPGLAHFLEHMLFLGNEKYKEESEYQNFVHSHGGMTNAFTTYEDTNYYFDVSYEFLEPTLDRFAQFFICPTFTESATQREMNAVDSEYQKNKTQDAWRLNHFNQYISNPNHPFNQFMIGNLKSLKDNPEQNNIDVRAALLNFHQKYYSADIMKLVILGRESLDDLQALATKLFSEIKNRDVKNHPEIEHFRGFGEVPVFIKEELPSWFTVLPKNDVHNLRIYWPMKSYHDRWEEKPTRFLGHLLGHEADGSLFAYLKKKGWAMQLIAGGTTVTSDAELFSCVIALSEEGLDRIHEIITLVYQYIDIIKQHGIVEYVFDELQKISDMEFRFQEKMKPASCTSSLAQYMQTFPPKHVLDGPYQFVKFDKEMIREVLSSMNPDNMIVQLISKKYEGTTDQKEPWYEIDYKRHPVDAQLINNLKNLGSAPQELYIPLPNEFIPTNFDIKEATPAKFPELIRDNPLCHLWHLTDTRFKKPKAHLLFHLISPEAYNTPMSLVLTSLFVHLAQDSLNEQYTYNADVAGLRFVLSAAFEGIQLEVAGFNEKVPLLTKEIVRRLANFVVQDDRFAVIKEQRKRDFDNVKRDQPYQRSQYLRKMALHQRFWTPEEKLEVLEGLTAQDLRDFIPKLLGTIKIRSLIQGNITSEETLQLVDELQDILSTKAIFPSQFPERRSAKLKKGVTYIYRSKIQNQHDVNSSVWNEYQIGLSNIHDDTVLELFSHVISVPFYEQIRTKEQLGYLVWTFFYYDSTVINFCCVVQSPQKDPIYLDQRIEAFLSDFKSYLEDLSPTDFQTHVDAVVATKLQKHHKLSEEVKDNWEEITSLTYQFNRKQLYAEEVKNITKEELIKFANEKIFNRSTRRKLSVQVFGTKSEIPSQQGEDGVRFITLGSENEFKSTLPLYPSRLQVPKL